MIDWMDRRAAWWAKIDHAKHHAERLRTIVAEYQATKPIRLIKEPTDSEVAYRLHIDRGVPIEVSLALGDVLHNARSALDALVYGMASDQAGHQLGEAEAVKCQFPICDSPDAFARFWQSRAAIKTGRLEEALHLAQPYYWTQQAKAMGIEAAQDESYELSSRLSNLWWLNRLSNIDKHRELPVVEWTPGLTYWGTDDGQPPQSWRYGSARFADGEIFGYASGGGEHGPNEVITDFNLSLGAIADFNQSLGAPRGGDEGVLGTANGLILVAIQAIGQVIQAWRNSQPLID
jgi:hypothetical protein